MARKLPAPKRFDSRLQTILAPEDLRVFCRRWRITRFELESSFARYELRRDELFGDVALYIRLSFLDGVDWSPFDFAQMKLELEVMTGRSVVLKTDALKSGAFQGLERREKIQPLASE